MNNIKLADIIGKITTNVDKLANWADKNKDAVLDSAEWSIFMDKAKEMKEKNKLSEANYKSLLGLETSARGTKINTIAENERDLANKLDVDKDGYLDTKEKGKFDAEVAPIREAAARQARLDSVQFSDDDLAAKRQALAAIDPFKYDYKAQQGTDTEASQNQKLIFDVAVVLDEVKDAAVGRNIEDSKAYINNSKNRKQRAEVAAKNPTVKDITGMNDELAQIQKGLEAKLLETIKVDGDKLTFTFKTKDGNKTANITKSVDLSKLVNLKRPFDLKKITETVKELAKVSADAQEALDKIQVLIDERNKAIDENNKQIQQRLETIASVEKQFKSSLIVDDETYNEVVKEIKNGTPVERLTTAEQTVYYQRQLKNAIGNGEVPFKVTEEKDKDGAVTKRTYELNFEGDAKTAYDQLNKLAPHLGLTEKVKALAEAKQTRDKLQIGSVVAQQEIAELTFAKNEITTVKTMVDEDLVVMQRHKKSMENGEAFIKEARKEDKKDSKTEAKRNKSSAKKTGKENKKYTGKAEGVSKTIETNENVNIHDGSKEIQGTAQGQKLVGQVQGEEITVDKKENRSTSYTQAISKHNTWERRANAAVDKYNDKEQKK